MKTFFKNLPTILFLFIFWVIGWWLFKKRNELKVVGRENMPKGIGILLLSNHQSLIDSLPIIYALYQPKDIIKNFSQIPWNAAAWENFFKKPSRRILSKFLKIIPVHRNGKLETINRNIQEYKNILNISNLLLFFEGTRSRNGLINRCRYGPAKIIADLKPITIPIRIEGMEKVMPINIGFNWLKIKGGQIVNIHIGPPIKFSSFNIEDIRKEIPMIIKTL
ncbi:1-acyl-sn-glycerol-3-phosphate acyltransferase [Patescibacteria group bacterium]|nr:1-acyl-sn-glycerol-3-phosphate acyltransferase [Patescibacteria group bacterium]